jgi:hypothetical protein
MKSLSAPSLTRDCQFKRRQRAMQEKLKPWRRGWSCSRAENDSANCGAERSLMATRETAKLAVLIDARHWWEESARRIHRGLRQVQLRWNFAMDVESPKEDTAAELPKLKPMLLQALDATAREDGWATPSALGSQITRNHPSFDPRNYKEAKVWCASRTTCRLRIPALLISQFDAVITWIGDHDRGLQLRWQLSPSKWTLRFAVEQQKSTLCSRSRRPAERQLCSESGRWRPAFNLTV